MHGEERREVWPKANAPYEFGIFPNRQMKKGCPKIRNFQHTYFLNVPNFNFFCQIRADVKTVKIFYRSFFYKCFTVMGAHYLIGPYKAGPNWPYFAQVALIRAGLRGLLVASYESLTR